MVTKWYSMAKKNERFVQISKLRILLCKMFHSVFFWFIKHWFAVHDQKRLLSTDYHIWYCLLLAKVLMQEDPDLSFDSNRHREAWGQNRGKIQINKSRSSEVITRSDIPDWTQRASHINSRTTRISAFCNYFIKINMLKIRMDLHLCK